MFRQLAHLQWVYLMFQSTAQGIVVSSQLEHNNAATTAVPPDEIVNGQIGTEQLHPIYARRRVSCPNRPRLDTILHVAELSKSKIVSSKSLDMEGHDTADGGVGLGESKPQEYFLQVGKGVEYHYRCPFARSQFYEMEWKTQKYSDRLWVDHRKIRNVLAFGRDSTLVWNIQPGISADYRNTVYGHYCLQVGPYECQYDLVGHYKGQVLLEEMTMFFITSQEDPDTRPFVQETCRFHRRGLPPGEAVSGLCRIEWIDVWPIDLEEE